MPGRMDPSGKIVIFHCNALQAVEIGLRRVGVTGYTVTKNGQFVELSGPVKYNADGGYSEIAGTMIEANSRRFKIAGSESQQVVENWKTHIEARSGAVQATKKVKFGFGFKLSEDKWLSFPETQEGVVRDNDVYSAIADFWNTPNEYELYCKQAVAIVMQIGIANAMGQLDYNKVANRELLAGGEYSLLKREVVPVAIQRTEWVPGDWGYIGNTGIGKILAAQEGENLVYLGGNKFWGHLPAVHADKSVAGLGEWEERVRNWNGSSTVSLARYYPEIGLEK